MRISEKVFRYLALTGVMISNILGAGCITVPITSGSPDFSRQIVVRDNEGFFSAGKILLIDVVGTISSEGSGDLLGIAPGRGMVARIAEELQQARGDEEIKAVLVRINSPGGTVTASDVIYEELKRYQDEMGVRIYAMMFDVAASGGYYIAMAADEVSALPTTITGSIGVIASFPLISELADWAGYEQRTFKSGANKDMGSLFVDFTDEQRVIIQGEIDAMYSRFVGIVDDGRPNLSRERIKKLADGRIYLGEEAQRLGLVDTVEYLPELVARIEEWIGGSAEIVSYNPGYGFGSSLYLGSTPP